MKLYLTSAFEWDRIMTENRTIVRIVLESEKNMKEISHG